MFDGPTTLRKFEIDTTSKISVAGVRNPAEIGGFCDSEETYNRGNTILPATCCLMILVGSGRSAEYSPLEPGISGVVPIPP